MIRRCILMTLAVFSLVLATRAQEPVKPTLYLVANAHLDSQWNWTVQDTIRELIPHTFLDNFQLLNRYGGYTFTLENAIHYMWFKEYHPGEWTKLQNFVTNKQWNPAGSWI